MTHTLNQTDSDTHKAHETQKRVCSIECKAAYSGQKTLGRLVPAGRGKSVQATCV